MATIQITSARKPFTSPALAAQAVSAVGRAEAMGLLPEDERIEILDLPALRRVVGHVQRAGIGRALGVALADEASAVEHTLERLNQAMEDSPAPAGEWPRLVAVLGVELLGRLLGISASSVRRYRRAARATPDDVAMRLHFLALVMGDLAGAYNDGGVRQWFDRRRTHLGGRAPAAVLARGWDPAAPGPGRVRALARSLAASPAT